MANRLHAILLLMLGCGQAFAAAPFLVEPADPLPAGARLRLGTVRLRHGEGLAAVAFSPDGRFLATGDHTAARLWDPRTGREIRCFAQESAYTEDLALARDGKTLATRSLSTDVHVWTVETGKLVRSFSRRGDSFALSPDGKLLALPGYQGAVHEVATGKEWFALPKISSPLVAFAGNETLVIADTQDSKVRFLNAATGKERFAKQWPIKLGEHGINHIAVSPDGKRLAISQSGYLRILETKSGREIAMLDRSTKGIAGSMTFSPDGTKLFACVSDDPEVLRWDIAANKESRLPGWAIHGGNGPRTIALSPDGRTIASTGPRVVSLQDADTGKPTLALPGHCGAVNWAILDRDGRTLATGGEDDTIRFWRAATGQEIRRLSLHHPCRAGVLASDGRTLITADDEMVRLWDLATGKSRGKLPSAGPVNALALGSGLLAVAADDAANGTLTLWDLSSGEILRRSQPHANPKNKDENARIYALTFSPDGKRLATAGADCHMRVHDPRTGKAVWSECLHTFTCTALAYSPDGRLLACQLDRGTPFNILLFAAATGKMVGRLAEGGTGHSLAFSPDGRLLAAASDARVLVIDVAERTVVRTLEGHLTWVNQVTFGADGRYLITASVDSTAIMWDLLPPAQGFVGEAGRGMLWSALADNARLGNRAIAALVARPELLPWLRDQIQARGEPLDAVRARRIVQALEWMNTPDAEKLLRSLTSADATAALQRLAARRRTPPLMEVTFSRRGPRVLQEHGKEVISLAFSPNGRTLASAGADGRLRLADVASGDVLVNRLAHTDGAFSCAFSPDGKTLATGGADRFVLIWDLAKKAVVRRLERLNQVAAVAFSPDGKLLAAGSYDGKICCFTLPGFASRSLGAVTGRVTSLSFSPDSRTLAVGGAVKLEGRAMAALGVLIDVKSGERVRDLAARGSTVAFTPDGELVLAAGLVPDADGNGLDIISLCRSESGEAAHRIPWRGNALALSGCGRLFASGAGNKRHMLSFDGASLLTYNGISSQNMDHSLRVWEVGSGQELLKLDEQASSVVALSPDGRTLAATHWNGVVLVWDLVLAANSGSASPANKDLGKLADALGGEAAAAFRAQAGLVLAGDRAVRLLGVKIEAVKQPVANKIERLLARLESDQFADREAAFAELQKLGDVAEPPLRRVLQGKPSLELRRRVERLLGPLQAPRMSAERLRQRRVVAVLQQIGSSEARKVLQRLANGAADAGTTREAKAALRWLDHQRPK